MEYVNKICPNPICNKTYLAKDYRQKYCSHSCSAKVNNGMKETIIRFCLLCNTKLTKDQRKFCSRSHQTKYKLDLAVQQWKLDPSIASSSTTGILKAWARNYLLALVGNRCSQCGWNKPNPKLGRPILTIDHIDGNWKNNSFDNLVVLCYNCHTLTDTFGALNIGSVSGRRAYGLDR